jgi:hypothetical protein
MQGSKVVSTCNRCTNIINLNNKSWYEKTRNKRLNYYW